MHNLQNIIFVCFEGGEDFEKEVCKTKQIKIERTDEARENSGSFKET